MTAAQIAAHGSYKAWKNATPAKRLAIATAWFDLHATAGQKAWIGPAAVAAQVTGEHREDVSSGLGGTLQGELHNAAARALNTEAGELVQRSFHGSGLVGSTAKACRQLLGPPRSQQIVSGHTIWYYDAGYFTSHNGLIQILFSGQTVAQVNLYGS